MLKALQFHRVVPDFQLAGTWNRPHQFRDYMLHLNSMHLKTVLPGDRGNRTDGVIIIFDDGEENLYYHCFPVLCELGIKAIIFLIVDYIGQMNTWDIAILGKRHRHLSWDQILKMKNHGIEFGSHGMTHRNLTILTDQEIEYELNESKMILEKKLGPIKYISYPFNRTNQFIINKTKAAGYEYGFGGNGSSDFLIKKEAVYITDNRASLGIKITEKPRTAYFYYRVQQSIINYFTITTMMMR